MGLIAYHYCTIDTFYRIISSKSLFLSDASKMNDTKELLWQRDLLEKVLKDYLIEESILRENINTYDINLPDVFICSFSNNGDLLSQWRAYSDNGKGVSIGFDLGQMGIPFGLPFTSSIMKHQIGFTDCIYDKKKQIKEIKTKLEYYLFQEFETAQTKKRLDFNGKLMEALLSIKRQACRFKHPSFIDEREIRIVFTPALPLFEIYNNEMIIGNIEILPLKIENNKRVFPMRLKTNIIFHEVIMGPNCKADKNAIRNNLDRQGLYNTRIDQSESPYISL